MRGLISLVMIVKDEAKSLRSVLETAKPFCDRYTIVDTGSNDGTQEIVREVMGDMPGKLYHEPFEGYMKSRNRALELDGSDSNSAIFSLFLSGDEMLRDGAKLREYLETQRDTNIDCHFIRLALENGMSYQARILRTGSKWRYEDFDCGVDEVPVYPEDGGVSAAATGGFIEHQVTDPIARMDQIWEVQIPLLRAALERNPNNARALGCLIQKLEAFFPHPVWEEGELEETAAEVVDLYRRRFELPFTYQEERALFMLHFIDTAAVSGMFTLAELFDMTDALCKSDPTRPEPFLMRAEFASKIEGSKVVDVYQFARDAAEVAEKVRAAGGLKNSSPWDMSTEWRAHRLAAIAASNIAKKYPDNKEQAQLVKDHISAGLSVGGPWLAFKNIVEEEAQP